jgi:hypothetical protein
MSTRKKLFLGIIGILGTLFVLLLVTLLLLPQVINLEPVKQKIQASVSQLIEGEMQYQRADVTFFPQPRVVIHRARIAIPDKAIVSMERMTIVPQIIPLLRGKLRISLIQAERPAITLDLASGMPKKEKPKEEPIRLSSQVIAETIAPLLGFLESKVPHLAILVEKGQFTLTEAQQPVFWFRDIQVRAQLPPDQLRVGLTCQSNLWGNISIAAQLDAKDLTGTGNIELTDFHPHVLLNYFAPATPSLFGDSRGNLRISLKMDQGKAFQGKIQGSSPYLTFQQGEKEWVLKGKALDGAFRWQDDQISFSLTELRLENPRIRLSGEFFIDPAAPHIRLEIAGREVDVSSVREIALGLAGKVDVLQTVFDIVRGGEIPYISFKTRGRSPADLGQLKNISLRGNMVGGRIFLSESLTGLKGIHFDLRDAGGDITISQGILQGKNLAAQWEKTRVSKGLLQLGLEGEKAPFHLEALADVDLSHLPPFLKKLIGDQTVSEEMDRLHELQGRARAKLVLGETRRSIQPQVEVQELNLSARYDRIPYPVQIESVQAVVGGGKIEVKNLKGAIGKSSFSEITARIDLAGTPNIGVSSGKSIILLEEIYAWLTSLEKYKVPLQDLKSLQGPMALSIMSLQGPLTQPGKWDFRIQAEIERLAMEASMLPGPLVVRAAKLDVTPEKILLQDSEVNLLDASLKVSAGVNGWQQGWNRLEGTFQGNLGAHIMGWAFTYFHVPENLKIHAPLAIRQTRVGWDQRGEIRVSGNLRWPEGPSVTIDLLYDAETLAVNRLLMEDEQSQADVGLKFHQKELLLNFKGRLEKSTLDRILVKNEFLRGSIRGDFQSRIFIDQPLRSTAHGKLKGVDLGLVLPLKGPLIVKDFSVDADKGRVHVESAALRWDDRHLTLGGWLDFSPEGFHLDMDVSVDGLEWAKIEKILKTEDQKTEPVKAARTQIPPLRGRIGFKSTYFQYKQFTWKPLDLEITLLPEGVKVTVREANVCGISTTGTVKTTSEDVALDFQPQARNQDLSPIIRCLLGGPSPITGNLDFYGAIRGRAQSKDLVQSLQGPLEIEAKDGRIYRESGSLAIRILEFLNLTELLVGEKDDPLKKGMDYKSFRAKGELRSGKLTIQELVLDASAMQVASQGEIDFVNQRMDLVIAVAPLKTVDWIVKHLPVVDNILEGTLISIPIRVQGDLKDPRIIPLAPGQIGHDLMGIMKRTLKLPFKVVQPIVKGAEKLHPQPEAPK